MAGGEGEGEESDRMVVGARRRRGRAERWRSGREDGGVRDKVAAIGWKRV